MNFKPGDLVVYVAQGLKNSKVLAPTTSEQRASRLVEFSTNFVGMVLERLSGSEYVVLVESNPVIIAAALLAKPK